MKKAFSIFALALMLTISVRAQIMQQGVIMLPTPGGGFTPITLAASCVLPNSTSGANVSCTSGMTLTGAQTIVLGCFANEGAFDPTNVTANDNINGPYGSVRGSSHPENSNSWVSVFVFENSAAGTIIPECQNWESTGLGGMAFAFSGTRAYQVLDGATAVNLFNLVSSAATNPTAGSAGSPANANDVIVCDLDLTSSTATTAGSGYSPPGTLTAVTNNIAAYQQYWIQTTASSANCNFGTGATRTYTDNQIAVMNAGTTGQGYSGLTGFYGIPSSAQTNGGSASVTILNTDNSGSSTTLASDTPGAPFFLLAGGAVTWDTSVHPIGSSGVIANGKPHVIGDAAASIKFPSANVTSAYTYAPKGVFSDGNGMWLGGFFRVANISGTGNFCDNWNLDSSLTGGNLTWQIYSDTGNPIHFQFERAQGNTPTVTGMNPSPALNLNQDYYGLLHSAGINEPNDEFFVYYEATPGTLPWVLHDHFTAPKSGQVRTTTTATQATIGSLSIVVASATNVVVGQSVYSATTSVDTGQIPLGAKVTSVAGTTIGISLATTASMSATPVEFAGNAAFQTCSVTGGSATLTCGAGTGLVAGTKNTGQYVGMPGGVRPGTWIASGSGTTWMMSEKAIATLSSQPTQFWNPDGSVLGMHFGKYSSCSFPGDVWYSAMEFDPFGGTLPNIANGNYAP